MLPMQTKVGKKKILSELFISHSNERVTQVPKNFQNIKWVQALGNPSLKTFSLCPLMFLSLYPPSSSLYLFHSGFRGVLNAG